MSLKKQNRTHPKKFALWLGIGSIIMMFAGLTSAYIVRRSQGNWTEYQLPDIFYYSTILIVLSSIALILAENALKKEKRNAYKGFLTATLLLGLGFIFLQWQGWLELNGYGIHLRNDNPSGAFLFVIAGLHALHVLGGAVFLVLFFVQAILKKDPVKALMSEFNMDRYLGIELLSTYWHFVGILWLYLLVFLTYFG